MKITFTKPIETIPGMMIEIHTDSTFEKISDWNELYKELNTKQIIPELEEFMRGELLHGYYKIFNKNGLHLGNIGTLRGVELALKGMGEELVSFTVKPKPEYVPIPKKVIMSVKKGDICKVEDLQGTEFTGRLTKYPSNKEIWFMGVDMATGKDTSTVCMVHKDQIIEVIKSN